jgi:hypothetical protein
MAAIPQKNAPVAMISDSGLREFVIDIVGAVSGIVHVGAASFEMLAAMSDCSDGT